MNSTLKEVRTLLLEIRRLEDETVRLEEGIGWLKAIKNANQNLVQRGREVYLAADESAFRDLVLAKQRTQQVILAQRDLIQRKKKLENKIESQTGEIKRLHRELQELLLKMEAIPEYATIQKLEFEVSYYNSHSVEVEQRFHAHYLSHRDSFNSLAIDDLPPTPPTSTCESELTSLLEAWPAWTSQLNQWKNLHRELNLPKGAWQTLPEPQRKSLLSLAHRIDRVLEQWRPNLDGDRHNIQRLCVLLTAT